MSDSASSSSWEMPTDGIRTGLRILNSISSEKSEFIPKDGRRVLWYICGPTVYDHSHVGHARNYVSFDILRRVMTDYFNYDVFYVMNITDIDDKIIIRTHQTRLARAVQAARAYSKDPNCKCQAKFEAVYETAEKLIAMKNPPLAEVDSAANALVAAIRSSVDVADVLKETFADVVVQDFDIQSEYLKLASSFETLYFKDMEALGMRPATAVTRVSEYVEEVVSFVQTIIDNGYGYESNGSVYFDIAKFQKDGYSYFKTSSGVSNRRELLDEGEGALTADVSEKRNSADFVLWKAAKPFEPTWDSPWGRGRPGWHIECSAMASDLLGSNVDINCGGCDLRFPHHDNQLAQSEAHFQCRQWVNYFLHTGHLHIDGLKMSKSLKNFITIAQSLKNHTARQLRLLFLTHLWSNPLEISLVGGDTPFTIKTAVLRDADGGDVDVSDELATFVTADPSVIEIPPKVSVDAIVGAGKKSKAKVAQCEGRKFVSLDVISIERGDVEVRHSVALEDGLTPDAGVRLVCQKEAGLILFRSARVEIPGQKPRDVSEEISALLPRDDDGAVCGGEIVWNTGTAVLASDAAAPDQLEGRLYLCLRVNGQEIERWWMLHVASGKLREGVRIIAPGVIKEMQEVLAIERSFSDFFLTIKSLNRRIASLTDLPPRKWGKLEREMHGTYQELSDKIHEAFCDSINTPNVIIALQRLVAACNQYMHGVRQSGPFSLINTDLLNEVAAYVTRILSVMGMIPESSDATGFPWPQSTPGGIEPSIASLLDRFAAGRDEIRRAARAKDDSLNVSVCATRLLEGFHALEVDEHPAAALRQQAIRFFSACSRDGASAREVLGLCDQVRDEWVTQCGVRFEDDGFVSGQSEWKLDDPVLIESDIHSKRIESCEKERRKAELAEKKRLQALEKAERARIPPLELFRTAAEYAGQYSEYDEEGVPTKLADGAEIGKKQRKRLQAVMKKHQKEHEAQKRADQ